MDTLVEPTWLGVSDNKHVIRTKIESLEIVHALLGDKVGEHHAIHYVVSKGEVSVYSVHNRLSHDSCWPNSMSDILNRAQLSWLDYCRYHYAWPQSLSNLAVDRTVSDFVLCGKVLEVN